MRRGPPRVETGLERLLREPRQLRGLRLGLVSNPTAVTSGLEHAASALHGSRGIRLVRLFGPEHGIWADAQDLVEVGDSRDPATGLPVFSLYGRTRVPTPEMLPQPKQASKLGEWDFLLPDGKSGGVAGSKPMTAALGLGPATLGQK